MKPFLLILLVMAGTTLAMAAAPAAAGAPVKAFPFEYSIDDLDNGLRVITVPLPYPDLVSFYGVVRAGSRNEVEEGKSGFAHFFEHMMFRGTEKYPPEKYNEIMKVIGADHNAFTSDDLTAYHALFGKQDLATVMELEADRFQNLKYPVEAFRTESKAVLGEYNKNSANPISKMFEVMRDKSFTTHTYKHTTMGFLKDIEDMPNQFEYSRVFFDRFYRPENVVLIVAGDVKRDEVLALARKNWGAWKRGSFTQEIPVEPEPRGPYMAHVDWPSDTLPWVAVGYRGPAYSDARKDKAALDLAGEIAFSQSSPLYQRLVIEEQKVDQLFTFFRDSRDPGLLYIGARVKDVKDVDEVRDAILATVADLRDNPVSVDRLAQVKSSFKYGFALSLDSTGAVAGTLAQYVQLVPTPETINKVFAQYDGTTAADIQEMCRKYFTEGRMTVGTLALKGTYTARALPPAEARAATSTASDIRTLLRPTSVPLVSLRVLFNVGAANDPPGKEGVAALTAEMLSKGGSRSMSYQQIVQAMLPMATSLSAQVDKEMTVFSGTTHADNLDAYYGILSSMILDPGWDEDDFRRVKDDAINNLKVNLRGNNDEELGKEALYVSIYGKGHPYGHENTGTVSALEKLTLDDVKAFYGKHYSRANLTLGLAGGYPAAFLSRVTRDFGRLPAGSLSTAEIPEAPKVTGQQLQIIKKETRATAISLGFPIPVTRTDKDWAALWLVSSYFGQHRSSNSYLYQRMREVRGLNYGDYAYIEYFPRGMFQFQPDPNLARKRQIFQIWIRPVEPANGHFALRIALWELKKLIDKGLGQEDFENTRRFLDKYVAVLAKTQDTQLGYALDGQYYGNGDFVPWARARLAALTLEDVNRAIRTYLSWENIRITVVTKEAESLRDAILKNAPSPITYNAPKPKEVTAEDRKIEKFVLSIKPENAAIVPIEEVFKE
ncbi:MAG TPA: pitrilysin family protein [Candidatus Polarisedimenticolia bacterium]